MEHVAAERDAHVRQGSLGASSLVVGLDAFAQGAPAWMLTIVGGVLADESDRRRVIVAFQSLQMLCPLR